MILYRPIGPDELRLIFKSGMCDFPPRFPSQPIFYPVLNEAYARQIAREWNAKQDSAGYVTRFEVEDEYVLRYKPKQVGARGHVELWVPAEELKEFNRHIVGVIEIVAAYFGPQYKPVNDGSAVNNYLEAIYRMTVLESA